MRFWDSSALVPLLSDEPTTDALQALFREDQDIVTASITPVEVISAICRKAGVNRELRRQAMLRLSVLQANWTRVEDHELRTGAAIQLACARRARPDKSVPIVTLDPELISAARAEGFTVLP